MSQYQLTWGVRGVIPEDARAAWGARAIYSPGAVLPLDLVWDRQSVCRTWGVRGAVRTAGGICGYLLSLLNGGILDTVQEVTRGGDPGSQEVAVLYDDDEVRVVGSPQGSHGYYYITAWLKGAGEITP